ncbi:transcriptional regulator (plasmid) [Azospirillum baldaniorum]|uniref:HTH_XRE family transcription factor n=1 Tax=Azospirillum baldaniorum TaxID=1064539 RepID=A0A9P1NS87_9PROT|nr:type II toxin-antitoxin system MqsA family antitoxin [Azospirillum baldaniorum]AWJ94426.1 transcriptional regulator [Azospirillum baldaniorum]TWA68760.1 putative transcriptional regulator [Azospirillum brasilense]CCD03914.1 putative HTH_XRE family transcription factor [Azospirillum baldaniorum]
MADTTKLSPAAQAALAAVDWKAIDAMTDDDIARQIAANPDAVDLGNAPPEALRVVHPPGGVAVRAIRGKLDLTQAEFAARFGFSIGAVRDWEQGRKQPDAQARVLLLLIDQAPDMVADAVRAVAA